MDDTKLDNLRIVKAIPEQIIDVESVLRTDLECQNKGCLILSTTGELVILSWIKKKLIKKIVQDISDALWQYGTESELVATCDTGAFLRYTLQYDTGLTCSLQLSAPTFLTMVKEKDPSLQSVKRMRIWSHTKNFILLQPQPDRLVLLKTNSGDRPVVNEVIRTMPLRSAYLVNNQVVAQPITGSELYLYDTQNGKATEVISLVSSRTGYIEWSSLSFSSSSLSQIALTDSERHLYIADLSETVSTGRKGGLHRSNLLLHQVIWPASIKPLSLYDLTITFSKDLFSLFCSTLIDEKEVSYYLTCRFKERGRLLLQHTFHKSTILIPGLVHELPDLFLSSDGISMLFSEDSLKCSLNCDLENVLKALEDALHSQDMNKLSEVKTAVEQDLFIFLSSCNQKENWLQLAETRSMQHAEMVNTILSHLTKLSTTAEKRPSALSLKEMTEHHFKVLEEEISNVMLYVDNESISQMLLKMSEQMKFYLLSLNTLHFPENYTEDERLINKFEVWVGKSYKEILTDALNEGCVKVAESYLKLKPWIYGEKDTESIISTCIEVAREFSERNLLKNLERDYVDILKKKLFSSRELNEILLIDKVLSEWDVFTPKEKLCLHLLKHIYMCCPYLATKPPRFWDTLVSFGNKVPMQLGELTIGTVFHWTEMSLMLVLLDLFARSGDKEMISLILPKALWQFLILKEDEASLLRWVCSILETEEESLLWPNVPNIGQPSTAPDAVTPISRINKRSQNFSPRGGVLSSSPFDNLENGKRDRKISLTNQSLLGCSIYGSDSESLYSVESSIVADVSASGNLSGDALLPYTITEWPQSSFVDLSQDMIDTLKTTPSPLSEKFLNMLSQFGVFLTEEKSRPDMIMKRWLTLPDFDMRIRKTSLSFALSEDSVDQLILNHYGQLDLHSPFYNYVEKYKIDLSQLALEKKPWMALIQPFMELSEGENIFECSLENLKYLISEQKLGRDFLFSAFLTMLTASNATLRDFLFSSVNNLDGETVENDETVIALTNTTIEELCSNTELNSEEKLPQNESFTSSENRNFEIENFTEVLRTVDLTPHSVVSKLAEETPLFKDILSQKHFPKDIDVSMYDLLNGNVPFDIGSLFTWQRSNKYGYMENSSLPSFTDPDAVKAEGAECSLDFCYYLRGGRPIFALASLIKEGKSGTDIEGSIYGLALSTWPDKRVGSACVALLFMMDLNYDLLRTIYQTSDVIMSMWSPEVNKTVSADLCQSQLNLLIQELQNILQQICCLKNRSKAINKLISYLEEATIAKVTNSKLLMTDRPILIKNWPRISWEEGGPFNGENVFYLLHSMKLSNSMAFEYNLQKPVGILEFLAFSNHWLIFLAAVELFNYPNEIVLKVSEEFQSPALKEHMYFALNNIYYYKNLSDREKRRGQFNSAKMRQTLYSKVGISVQKECLVSSPLDGSDKKSGPSSPSSIPMSDTSSPEDIIHESGSSCSSPQSSPTISFPTHENVELMSIYLKCHNENDPVKYLLNAALFYKTPVFAVFASCYVESDKIACLIAWMSSVIPDQFEGSSTHIEDCSLVESMLCSDKQKDFIRDLFLTFVRSSLLDALQDGLKIFISKSYLLPILESLEACNVGKSVDFLSSKLEEVSAIPEESDLLLLIDKTWLEELCFDVMCCGLDEYIKNYAKIKYFLEAFCQVRKFFPFSTFNLNWEGIVCVVGVLGENGPQPFKAKDIISMYKENKVEEIGKKIVAYFTDLKKFDVVTRLTDLFSFSHSDILCKKFEDQFSSSVQNLLGSFSCVSEFLLKIYNNSLSAQIEYIKISKLFENMALSSTHSSISYVCYSYALICLYNGGDKTTKPFEKHSNYLEMKVWKSYILSKYHKDILHAHLNVLPPKLFKHWPWESQSIDVYFEMDEIIKRSSVVETFPLQDYEKELKDLIDICLEKSLLITALRICNLFEIENKDVKTLQYALTSANTVQPLLDEEDGSSTPESIQRKSLKLSQNLGCISPFSKQNFLISPDLVKLASGISHGKEIVKRIIMLLRTAIATKVTFSSVIRHTEPTKLLKDVLALENEDNLVIAKELIGAFPISFSEVNRFLIEEAVATITSGPGDCENTCDERLLSWKALEERWIELLSLADSPSAIGHQLLEIRQDFGSTHPDQIYRVHSMSVELAIRAHDCFSQAASIEGISILLQTCVTLSQSLLKNRLWQLMVRLLTGIRRYNEMSYIIDILREKDQFEFLLGRISDSRFKKSGLDRALLHYLRTKCPRDKESLKLVALHFLLYSEVAKIWEEEAISVVDKVLKDSIYKNESDSGQRSTMLDLFKSALGSESPSRSSDGSSDRNDSKRDVDYLKNADETLLLNAVNAFSHAAQYYLQDDQTTKAVHFSRQAQLTALQVSLIRSAKSKSELAVRVLRLPMTVVNIVLKEHLSVMECLIVSRAYEITPDWSPALYNHVIREGDVGFLKDFLQVSPLSPDIILDITKRIEASNNAQEESQRMTWFLRHITDVPLVYQVASRLSLREAIDHCLKSPAMCYLQDTVFKKGGFS